MATPNTRTSADARVAHLDHGGKRLTVRLVSPIVSSDGRDIRPDTPVVCDLVPHFPGRSMIVNGWAVPSTFEVEGIEHLRLTFDLVSSNPLTLRPLAVTNLRVEHLDPVWRQEWKLTDLPPVPKLLAVAIGLAAVVVRRTPGTFPGGADRYTFRITAEMSVAERRKVERQMRKAHGTTEVIGLASGVSPSDRAALEGKRRRDVPRWDSAEALRQVAKIYTEAYRDGGRPLKPIERHIADQTHRAPGTVRRQITEARKRGYIAEGDGPPRTASAPRKRGGAR